MPKRSGQRDTAKAEYIARRSKGEKVNLRELAESLGVNYQTLRNWKRDDKWDEALPKKKRGGQPGNKNSKGKKNAAGSHPGAPPRNRNAEKDGAYSAVFFDMLSDAERDFIAKTPMGSREALEHEMQILKFREHRILEKIAQYESVDEDTLYVSSLLDMKGGEADTEMWNKDSAFTRVLKLQEALYKVQGRIAKIADSLRSMEEYGERMKLEEKRLEIMRMRATGAVDPDPPDDAENAEPLPGMEVEDIAPDVNGEEE